MPSAHGHRFNHDDEAAGYDEDVRRSTSPIRAGYADVLAWVAGQTGSASRILDLGVGTGNLVLHLPASAQVTAVDLSGRMLDVARTKLAGRAVDFVQQDLFDAALRIDGPWDAVVSTYAIHHLEAPEKRQMLGALAGRLTSRGVIAVGDLMFENPAEQAAAIERWPRLREAVDDEFFWDVEQTHGWLAEMGLAAQFRQFSPLSWAFVARRA